MCPQHKNESKLNKLIEQGKLLLGYNKEHLERLLMLLHRAAGARERERGLEKVCSPYQNEPHLCLLGVDPGKRLFTGQLDTDIYSSLFMISHCPWQAVCELTGGPQPEQTARERRLIGTDPRTDCGRED